MNRQLVRDSLGWGFVLWLIGYVLGIILVFLVPVNLIGWIIAPIGAAITFWVAFKKLRGSTLAYFALVALVWLFIAVLGDYLFIVMAFRPADGYYKPAVHLYYALIVAIPLLAGWGRTQVAQRELTRSGSG